jgi:phosphoserine phosphatase RsbU/P
MLKRRPWKEELAIIDQTMKDISGILDPEKLVDIYWRGVGKLIGIDNYLALSRRNVEPPFYLITRSSRFAEQFNPWTQRELLPKLSGGLLGEIAYANRPMVIEDLPARLAADDPAYFYLEGFAAMIVLPQYDAGEALNITIMFLPPGEEIEHSMVPMLHWQGGLFGRGTQNLVLRNQLSATLSVLDRELQVVGHIQRSLLPRELPRIPGIAIATFYQTSARAGGDYYDFFPLADGGWGMFIADVSGHGTPAAVLMAITHAIAHAQPGTHTPPGALVDYLNNQLACAYTREGTFVTAFYAVFDPASRRLTYSRAGHNPPRLVRDRRIISLDGDGGLPLGIDESENYAQASITLERNDLLLLYTDGIIEAAAPPRIGERRELFGLERLDKLLTECDCMNVVSCVDRIKLEVAAFTGNGQPIDDQTLIAIRCE